MVKVQYMNIFIASDVFSEIFEKTFTHVTNMVRIVHELRW